MMGEIEKMINDMIKMLRASGISVPDAAAQEVEVLIRAQYGGERIYVASLPKQQRAVQLAKLEKMTQINMAIRTGIPIRTIRRIRNGK